MRCMKKFYEVYEEILFWRWNLFKLPSGATGKRFIAETTKLVEFWNQDASEFKDIALKIPVVILALLLQKPAFKSTAIKLELEGKIDAQCYEAVGSTQYLKRTPYITKHNE